MKKAQMELIVGIIVILIGFFVVAEVIHQKIIVKQSLIQKEKTCEIANQISQQSGIQGLHKLSLRMCTTIDLENLPLEGYEETTEDVKKIIAEKAAKTWDIWMEGRKNNLFDSKLWPAEKPKCFIQYTFNIKQSKKIKPIKPDELMEYMYNTPYKIDDKSDRCAGTQGGWCSKIPCGKGERSVEAIKPCPDKNSYCCLKSDSCENKGGTCKDSPCPVQEFEYADKNWRCDNSQVCCIANSNYITLLDYIQANNGVLTIAEPLYPQKTKVGKEEKSNTYAIVMVSNTLTFASWQRILGCTVGGGAGAYIGKSAGSTAIGCVGGAGAADYFAPDEGTGLNGVIITPLSNVDNYCAAQAESMAGAANA